MHRLSKIFLAPLLAAVALAMPASAEPRHFDSYTIAVLQGLDKMNARVQTMEVPVDKPFAFGALEINVRSCRKTPAEETPEAAAYIDISDTREKEGAQKLFHGWMFASSPALSALENPNYDVWVLDCKNASAPARSASKPASSPKKASPDKASPKSE
ncbi:MAG TPA: DUF2155 domain-containing protein [Alphaproteobacteria bacterium]|nr:DUF2155 domain-containing protein [Alphaproteobacteria bacterium]